MLLLCRSCIFENRRSVLDEFLIPDLSELCCEVSLSGQTDLEKRCAQRTCLRRAAPLMAGISLELSLAFSRRAQFVLGPKVRAGHPLSAAEQLILFGPPKAKKKKKPGTAGEDDEDDDGEQKDEGGAEAEADAHADAEGELEHGGGGPQDEQKADAGAAHPFDLPLQAHHLHLPVPPPPPPPPQADDDDESSPDVDDGPVPMEV
jgi:hypothetical protein